MGQNLVAMDDGYLRRMLTSIRKSAESEGMGLHLSNEDCKALFTYICEISEKPEPYALTLMPQL